jgi:hypothetical protein
MPREDRRILFSNDEVYKALFALCAQKQIKKPPPGLIKRILESPQDPSILLLDLENPQDKTSARLEYTRDFMAAALMLFCRGCGIPLPKSAKKSVMLGTENDVILRVQI